eukprot:CAMPEP_0174890384 /NCGR_PEP_ID=MMETSP0167-20121228/5545_1 /TAXON_ID=38298 /ORGANISM="Rhodella maculata, Strain CCMP736" /LENGTH=179 /DNA_ID=CAMNT_0016128177 /DNA_START=42 /DNA_END=577 /DNA_ORIENTATION=+
MATVGWFSLAGVAAELVGWRLGMFLASVGTFFWGLVVVTLFQRSRVNMDGGGEKPTPVVFLLIAPPAAAAIAWSKVDDAAVAGSGVASAWDRPSAALFFLMLDHFFFALLLRLLNLYVSRRFAITWWAYIFPLSTISTATILAAAAQPPGTAEETAWKAFAWLFAALAAAAIACVAFFT